jgi:hypothetical protein
MNKILSVRILIMLSITIGALYVASRITAASGQQKMASDTVQNLHARVAKLETQIADLQAQVKLLSSHQARGVLALPGAHVFPGNQIPPGAQQHEIGGIKYWTIPIKESH